MPSITKSLGLIMLVSASTSVLAAPQFNADVNVADNNDSSSLTNANGSLSKTLCKKMKDLNYVPEGETLEKILQCASKATDADLKEASLQCPGLDTCNTIEALEALLHPCWAKSLPNAVGNLGNDEFLLLGKGKSRKLPSGAPTEVKVDADVEEDAHSPKNKSAHAKNASSGKKSSPHGAGKKSSPKKDDEEDVEVDVDADVDANGRPKDNVKLPSAPKKEASALPTVLQKAGKGGKPSDEVDGKVQLDGNTVDLPASVKAGEDVKGDDKSEKEDVDAEVDVNLPTDNLPELDNSDCPCAVNKQSGMSAKKANPSSQAKKVAAPAKKVKETAGKKKSA